MHQFPGGPRQWNDRGAYNRDSNRQAASGAAAVPLLEQAARLVDPVSSAAIAVLRGRFGTEIPICVAHTNLPDNDFSALFRILHTDPDSYLKGDPNAYWLPGR
jgi:hypothetical protein